MDFDALDGVSRSFSSRLEDQKISATVLGAYVDLVRELDRDPNECPPRSQDSITRIRHAIRVRLANGPCERSDVAADIRMSIRTMTRRLNEAGYDFRSLRDEVRQPLAVHYLAVSTLPLREVASKLGISGLPVLCKLCRKWFGMTPRALRDTLVGQLKST